MNCDCGRDDILELGDGKRLCIYCRCELENSDSKFCGAWWYRGRCGEISVEVLERAFPEPEIPYDPHVARQSHAPIEPFSKGERPKLYFSRRWQEDRDNVS